MRLHLRFRAGDDVRALWLLAVFLLAGGWFYVHRHFQTVISASYVRTEHLYRDTVADERIVHQASRLREIQNRVQDDLRRVSHAASPTETTAAMLSTLHRSGVAFHVHVLEVQPGADKAVPSNALEATDLTIRVRGAFRDVLGFVEDLSHHSTLVSVADTELALTNQGQAAQAQPRLDATIHATLYRMRMPEEQETSNGAAR